MSIRKLALSGSALLALMLGTTGCVTLNLFPAGGPGPLTEQVLQGEHGPKILMLDIDGMITSADSSDLLGVSEESTVARVRETLDAARKDAEIKGLLLRIDSPGGSATASEQIYSEIVRYKRQTGIPVFAQMLSTAASGGYYIAMAADEVQAHPTTITGSIGVIFVSVNFAGLMEKWGIEDQTITAGAQKDAGSMLRRMTPAERAQFQSVVDELHTLFKQAVKQGRPALTAEQIDVLADGRIFSAKQALDAGLVDHVGTLEESIDALEKAMGVPTSRVIVMKRPTEWRRNIYERAPAPPRLEAGGASGMTALLSKVFARPGFHYLWWPGLQP